MALSTSGRSPVQLPDAVGLKVTLIVQVPCAATLAPQVLVCTKSPVTDISVKLTVAAPLLVTFKDFGATGGADFLSSEFQLGRRD